MKPTLTHRVRTLAFTLVELIIVIGIIAVLAAMIFPAFSGIKKRNYILKARAELKQLEVAIGSYKARTGFLPPGNRLERLRGNRVGQWSIRINDQWRVCFRWDAGHADDLPELGRGGRRRGCRAPRATGRRRRRARRAPGRRRPRR